MKLLFFFLLLVINTDLDAQILISNSKNSFIYAACDNTIEFTATKNSQKLSLQASCGSLKKLGKNKYSWKICRAYQNFVSFYIFYAPHHKIIDSAKFSIRLVPEPTIKILTFDPPTEYNPPGGVPKALSAIVEDKDYAIQFTIKEFQITLVKLCTDTIILKNVGAFITKDNLHEIFKLKKGDQYQFSQIVVVNECEGKERILKETEFIKLRDEVGDLSTTNDTVLYYAAVNSLQFLSAKFDYKKFKPIASAGTIKEYGNSYYTWQTCDTNIKQVVFKCYRNKKMIERFQFKIKQVPNPIAFVAPSKEYYSFERSPKGVRTVSFVTDLEFFVKKFTVVVEKSNGDKSYYDNEGPAFSWELFNIIKQLKKGDKYKITNIIVHTPCEKRDREIADTEFYTLQ